MERGLSCGVIEMYKCCYCEGRVGYVEGESFMVYLVEGMEICLGMEGCGGVGLFILLRIVESVFCSEGNLSQSSLCAWR